MIGLVNLQLLFHSISSLLTLIHFQVLITDAVVVERVVFDVVDVDVDGGVGTGVVVVEVDGGNSY